MADMNAPLYDIDRPGMEVAVNSWKYALSVRKGHALDHPIYYNSGNGDSKKSIKAEIEHYARKIRVLDPAYKAPKPKGCYSGLSPGMDTQAFSGLHIERNVVRQSIHQMLLRNQSNIGVMFWSS